MRGRGFTMERGGKRIWQTWPCRPSRSSFLGDLPGSTTLRDLTAQPRPGERQGDKGDVPFRPWRISAFASHRRLNPRKEPMVRENIILGFAVVGLANALTSKPSSAYLSLRCSKGVGPTVTSREARYRDSHPKCPLPRPLDGPDVPNAR